MEENVIGTALAQDQVSHYNAQTNHCYVKLEVSTANLDTPQALFIRDKYLIDGQTKEMLARASWKGSTKFGQIMSDSLNPFVRDPAIPTYEETDTMIEKFTTEDRKP